MLDNNNIVNNDTTNLNRAWAAGSSFGLGELKLQGED